MMRICSFESCGKPHYARGWCKKHHQQWWKRGYVRNRPTVEERFWQHVRKGSPDECWPWTASFTTTGYGQFRISGRTRKAHQVSWELHNGPIPDGLFVLHRCDYPPCVNPAHLFLGTNRDNYLDSAAKGRDGYGAVYGEANPAAKLTADQVRTIRERHAAGASGKSLARAFGVSKATVQYLLKRKTWAHVGGGDR